MSKFPTTFDKIVSEGSTAVYTTSLEDENQVSIGSGTIDSLTVTLCNVADGTILNSRDDMPALNANNVTVSGAGALVFTLQPADTAIVDSSLDYETHRVTFKCQYNTTGFLNWDVDINIRNLSKVP